MRYTAALTLLMLCTLGLSACDKKPSAESSPANGSASALPAACEQYLQKYQSCLNDKVPSAAKPMLEQSFKQTREAWEKANLTPEGKAGLAMACEQASSAAKASMQSFGCSM